MINAFRNYSLMLVVFIHAHIYTTSYQSVDVPQWLVYFYNNCLGFFHPASVLAAISGFLFFKDFSVNHKNWSVFYGEKYFKRMKSIFVPFFFWVTVFFIINNVLIYFSSASKPGLFVSEFSPISLTNYIKAFFYPELAVAKHLWYLNNMLFAFAIAPVILMLNRNKTLMGASILLMAILYYFYWRENTSQAKLIIKYRFIVFFMAGSFFGLNKQYFNLVMLNKAIVVVASVILFCIAFSVHHYTNDFAFAYVMNSVTITILVFMLGYFLIKKFTPAKDTIYNRSEHFFLYIIHPFLLSLLCKGIFTTGAFTITNYWIALVFILALSFAVVKLNKVLYKLFSRYFKKLSHEVL